VVQKLLRDGTRKVIQISEVVGIRDGNPNVADINDLYIFDIDEEPEYDEVGNLLNIRGRHRRVGKLSDRTIRKLKLEGVATSRYDFLLKDVNDNEKEEYTGENIEKYGF